MRSDLSDELAEFRREVRAAIDTALSEADAPLAVGDLKRDAQLTPPPVGFAKATSACQVLTTGGKELREMDHELSLLERTNAALFAALAQTRALPVRSLPNALEARLYSLGAKRAESERIMSLRLQEAAELQQRERRRKQENRRLLERTRDLRKAVSDLENQKRELTLKLEEKRLRRERLNHQQTKARQREERKRAHEEARVLRERVDSAIREADRLRERVKGQEAEAVRSRAREALLRWRARTVALRSSREARARSCRTSVAKASERTSAAALGEIEVEREHGDSALSCDGALIRACSGSTRATRDINHCGRFLDRGARVLPEYSPDAKPKSSQFRNREQSYRTVVCHAEGGTVASISPDEGKVERSVRAGVVSTADRERRVRQRRGRMEIIEDDFTIPPPPSDVQTQVTQQKVDDAFMEQRRTEFGRSHKKQLGRSLQQMGISNGAFHQRRQAAVNAMDTLSHRRRLAELRQSLRIWWGAGRSANGEGQREQMARELGRPLRRRSARISILTKSFSCWKAFAVASRSTRRLDEAAEQEARRIQGEKRRLGIESTIDSTVIRLAFACKAVVEADGMRRKACAWHRWRYTHRQQLTGRERQLVNHVLLRGVQRRRQSLLRVGIRKFREGCLVVREHKILLQARVSRLRSLAFFLRARRAPKMDIAQAFTIWTREVSEVKVQWSTQWSTVLARAATRLNPIFLKTRRGALSRRFGIWRSYARAEAIAVVDRRVAGGLHNAAVRVLAATTPQVQQRQMASGLPVSAIFMVKGSTAKAQHEPSDNRMVSMLEKLLERTNRRDVRGAWKRWLIIVTEKRMRGAVGEAKCSLEWERDILTTELTVLKRRGAARLLSSLLKRSERRNLKEGWNAFVQAGRARTIIIRAAWFLQRSRLKLVRLALHRWRVSMAEIRAEQAQRGVRRAVLSLCFAAMRRRELRTAWTAWTMLLAHQREKEHEFAAREARVKCFILSLVRLGAKGDSTQMRRALMTWRIEAGQMAIDKARKEAAAMKADLAQATKAEKATLLVTRVDRREAAVRLALRWLHRRKLLEQLAAWKHWRAIASARSLARYEEKWRSQGMRQLAKELSRVVEGRRHRILRRFMSLWRRQAEGSVMLIAARRRQTSKKKTGVLHLYAVLDRNLLRRKARAWARLLRSALATSSRLDKERDAEVRLEHLLVVAKARSHYRRLHASWSTWKNLWAARRHRGEIGVLRAQRGAASLMIVARRKEVEARREALVMWRTQTRQKRERERKMSRVVACFLRINTRFQRARLACCLVQWRVWCAREGQALAEERMASTKMALRAQSILVIIRRRRLRRLGEGFRHLVGCVSSVALGKREEQARREDAFRILRCLSRTISRRVQLCLMRAFARWRCFAAKNEYQLEHTLLIATRRRGGVQILSSLVNQNGSYILSRAWARWRSVTTASTVIQEDERALADVRVCQARYSAGVRLLSMTLVNSRRRSLLKAWRVWCREIREVRAVANAEFQGMEKYSHLARTLVRVERRTRQSRLSMVWWIWVRYVRAIECYTKAALVVRRGKLADVMARWWLACQAERRVEAEQAKSSAEFALRSQVMGALLQRLRIRTLKLGFYTLFDHGAWAIYGDKQQAACVDRFAGGLRIVVRLRSRAHERKKFAAFGNWRLFIAECRRRDDRALLQAADKRAVAKALLSLVTRRESASVARTWGVWKARAALATSHEDERASSDHRVFRAQRTVGAHLLAGVLTRATRKALTRSWSSWCKETKAVADVKVRSTTKHLHVARTIWRVERRTQLTRLSAAWRTWKEFVRVEEEAEVQALERHFHVAHVVMRVVRRTQRRRLVRAWVLWARLAARGGAEIKTASPVLEGLPVARRAPLIATGIYVEGVPPADKQLYGEDSSRRVRHRAAAVTLRGLVRRSCTRSLERSWRTWRAWIVAQAGREARIVIGATRLDTLLAGVLKDHEAKRLQGFWARWLYWSSKRGKPKEIVGGALGWDEAQTKTCSSRMSPAGKALTAFVGLWDACLLRHYFAVWVSVSSGSTDTFRRRGLAVCSFNRIESGEGEGEDEREGEGVDTAVVGVPVIDKALERESITNKTETHGEELVDKEASVAASPLLLSEVFAARQKLERESHALQALSTLRAPLDTRCSRGLPSSPQSATVVAFSPSSPSVEKIGLSRPLQREGQPRDKEVSSPIVDDCAWSAASATGNSSMISALQISSSTTPSPFRAFAFHVKSHGTGSKIGECGSLDLSDSTGSVGTGIPFGPPSVFSGSQISPTERNTVMDGTSVSVTEDGPTDSLTHASESILLGEGVVPFQSEGFKVDYDGTVSKRTGKDLSWVDASDGFDSSDEGKEKATATPGVFRSRAHFSSSEAGTTTWPCVSFRQRSPPYAPGSVHASPSVLCFSTAADTDFSGTGERSLRVPQSPTEAETIPSEPSDEGSGIPMSEADAFMSTIMMVLWRRAFKRWVWVHRSAMYELRMLDATRKVAFLRRQQKLRRVVVGALRRQSYAWHVSDTSRGMRKWKEFVRQQRDGERELSRLSAASTFSPLTPRSAREHTAGSWRTLHGSVSGVTSSIGVQRTDEKILVPYPSPLSPATNSARRLWDNGD